MTAAWSAVMEGMLIAFVVAALTNLFGYWNSDKLVLRIRPVYLDDMRDPHRVLVDADDVLGNVAQIRALRRAGYAGPVSFFRLPTLAEPQDADIALLGLPYDGGTTNLAGTRHGPREMRAMNSPTKGAQPIHQAQ